MTQENIVNEQELQQTISDLMLELGIPAHLRGYQYVRSAVSMCVQDLAKMYQTTDQKIERAIRNAIEVSWGRGNDELFEEMFGFCSEYTRPTNSEYIAVVADYIRIKYHLL